MRGSFPVIAFLASMPLIAQEVPGRYIVELDGAPAALAAQPRPYRNALQNAAVRARAQAVQRQQQAVTTSIEREGGTVVGSTHVVTNALVVEIPESGVSSLAAIAGVRLVHPVRMYKALLDHALPLLKVPDAWAQIGGMDKAGLGMRIGIIDTGIDVRHPGFQDSSLPVPDGFPIANKNSDLAFTNKKIIVARSYRAPNSIVDTSVARDDIGHGTSVAMVAAGASNTGPFGLITGVAPKAYLGNYKVFPNPNGGAPTDLILKAIDDAVADGMDVINLSLGSFPATRPTEDILVTAVENTMAAGVLVAIAAGNDGSDPNTISSPATAPSVLSVGSIPDDRVFAGSIRLANSAPVIALPGDGPNSAVPISGPIADVAALDPTGLVCGALSAGSLTGTIVLVLRGTCTFEQKLNTLQQAGALAAVIYTDAARPDAINMAVGQASLPASMVSYADGIALKQQLSSGSAPAVLDFTLGPLPVSAARLSSFSSRGPNTDNGIKPDLVAPGGSISTARPSTDPAGGYTVVSGTSFSAPMVAGAAAVLKAARPGLTAQQYRSLLIDSASRVVTDSGALLPVEQEGAGLLNLFAAINGTVVANPATVSFGVAVDTDSVTKSVRITNVGATSDVFRILVQPFPGTVAPAVSADAIALDPGQSQDMELQLVTRGLPSGAYQGVIQIQGDSASVAAHVPYWYGVPSQTASYLTILRAPATGTVGSRQTITFRATDGEGIPVVATPAVSFASGDGSVVAVNSADEQFPGAYSAIVRLGAGQNVIHIEVNGFSRDITIPAN